MTPEEFQLFSAESRARYVEDKINANDLKRDEAEKIADADFERILPNGYHSKDNFLYTLIDHSESNVGYLWYCVRGSSNIKKAFIADIMIREQFRGHGYGKQAMMLLEDDVKSKGLKHIGLHVFGFNDVAIHLYNSMGYRTTDLIMEKSL